MGVQRSLTGTSALSREGGDEDSPKEVFEEDTKLELEDYSGIRYSMDPQGIHSPAVFVSGKELSSYL